MPYVTIDTRDGEFEVRTMSDEDADCVSQQGATPTYITDAVYTAWCAHQQQHAVFNTLWLLLQNDYSSRRHGKR